MPMGRPIARPLHKERILIEADAAALDAEQLRGRAGERVRRRERRNLLAHASQVEGAQKRHRLRRAFRQPLLERREGGALGGGAAG